jgi:hypothetical protein
MTNESATKLDRIFIEVKDRDKYDFLKNKVPFFKTSTGASRENVKVFMYVVAYAIKNNISKKKLRSPEGYFKLDTIKDDDHAMIKSIAVHDEGIDVLSDPAKIYTIVQEYANAGIKSLYDEIIQLDESQYNMYSSNVEDEFQIDDTAK